MANSTDEARTWFPSDMVTTNWSSSQPGR